MAALAMMAATIRKKVMKNMECDLTELQAEELWSAVLRWLAAQGLMGPGDEAALVFVWASVPCTTYTQLDSMQKVPYRYHVRLGNRPPMRAQGISGKMTPKGKTAHQADKDVQAVLDFFQWAQHRFGASWGMENPEAWLRFRAFMQEKALKRRGLQAVRHTVNYCNWGHIYFKRTNIWTSVKTWVPRGRSGDGRCHQKCGMGEWCQETNGFRHFNSIGQESWRLKRGVGKQALKNLVPGGIHKELFGQL